MKPDFSKLQRAFNPKVIAIVGDKSESNYMWLRSHSNFKGKLYSIQVNPKEIEGITAMGIENYTSIVDVPEPVDLAIIAVPRVIALKVTDECIQKDVAAAHFFTAGFSETHTEEGREFERQLTEKAEAANFHIVGPNCMGVFVPSLGVGMSFGANSEEKGKIGFISQSGTHAVALLHEASTHGVSINKAVSFGNGTVLDSPDYLEFFGNDPDIEIIAMYIEGVKDGRRFLRTLKEVAARKPVVIWKGGRTEEGGRAISSHTASLAVPQAIWDSAVRQCGALKVNGMDQMMDTLKALLYLPEVKGNRVAITGGSGGQSVAVTDAFAETGLNLPMLTQESYDELASFFTLIGGGYLNPIDTGNTNRAQLKRILDIIDRDTNTDNIVLLMNAQFGPPPGGQKDAGGPGRRNGPTGPANDGIQTIIDVKNKTDKPVMVILSWSFTPGSVEQATGIIKRLQDGGVPAYISLERGAFGLKQALEYYTMKASIKAG